MGAMASQIVSLTIVYSTVYSGADRRKHQFKLRVTSLCAGNSPVTGEFPAQMTSNAENVSIWWRHHEHRILKVTHFALDFMQSLDYQNHSDMLLCCYPMVSHMPSAFCCRKKKFVDWYKVITPIIYRSVLPLCLIGRVRDTSFSERCVFVDNCVQTIIYLCYLCIRI